MNKTFIELFIIGITVSFGPCLVFCSPVILSYIAGIGKGWKQGLVSILLFSFTQLIIYCILGSLLGIAGSAITQTMNEHRDLIFIIGGSMLSLFGLLIIFGKEIHFSYCKFLKDYTVDNIIIGSILLGLVVGILPCLPFLGVLTFILLKAEDLWQGAFLGFAFGMGKFISPLIPLGILAGGIPNMFIRKRKIYIVFTKICGLLLFLIGINLVISNSFS